MTLRKLKKSLMQDQRTLKNKGPFQFRKLVFLGMLVALALVLGYREYQQVVPPRLYRSAMAFEGKNLPEKAFQDYVKLFSNYPQSDLAADALFRAGRISQVDLGREQQALIYYLRLEHDYPQSSLANQARLQAAELTKYRLRDCAQAIVIYQRLLDHKGAQPDRSHYELADCYFSLGNYTQTRIELEEFLRLYPSSPLVPEVLYRQASAYRQEGNLELARAGLMTLVEKHPDSPFTGEARFKLAEILEEQDLLLSALKEYKQLKSYSRQDLLHKRIESLKKRIAKKKKAI